MRNRRLASCAIVLLCATALSCGRSDPQPPTPPATPSPPPTPTPTPSPNPNPSPNPSPTQPTTEPQADKPQADEPAHRRPPAGAHVRVIHPLSADMELCIEMYSVCKGSGNRKCTSAPLHIECGDAAELPGSPEHEWLDCACP